MTDLVDLQISMDDAKDFVIQRVLEFVTEHHKQSTDFDSDYWASWNRLDEALEQYVNAYNDLKAYKEEEK